MKAFRIGLILSILIAVVGYWRWFFTPDIYAWGDWGFHWPEIIRPFFWYPQGWLPEFLGMVDIGLSQYLTTRFLYSLYAHFLPFVGYDRLVFLVPSVLAPAVGVYLLVRNTTRSAFAGVAGSLVYAFNSYILLLNTGHLTLSTAYGTSPFVFLLYKAAVDKRSLKYSLAAGIAGFISSSYDPRGFYLVSLVLMLYLVFNAFTQKFRWSTLTFGLLPLIIVGFAHIFWIVALPSTLSSYQGIVLNTQIVGGTAYAFPRALMLFSPWWTGGSRLTWGEIQKIPIYFWVVPVAAFFGFWINRKNKDILFWGLIAIIGIFLVKSTGSPVGDSYTWFYSHIPGFNAFRDSSKFNYLVSLSYSVLIGGFVSKLWSDYLITKKNSRLLIIVLVLGVFILNAVPQVKGELGRLSRPRTIPADYWKLRDFLKSQDSFQRVLYVPTFSKWAYRDRNHLMLGIYPTISNQWRDLNDYTKTGLEHSAFEESTGIFTKDFSNDLLDKSAIKYVILPPEDLENDEMFLYHPSTTKAKYKLFLDTLPYLKPVNLGLSNMVIYENEGNYDKFTFDPKVDYRVNCPDATTCNFKFNSSAENVKLHFSESYHPGWSIRLGDFSWLGPLTSKNYYINPSLHTRTDYDLNEYALGDIKAGQKATLYFAPQSIINIGSIISGSTLSITFILMIYLWRIRK